jgi:primosomal protein DnaI
MGALANFLAMNGVKSVMVNFPIFILNLKNSFSEQENFKKQIDLLKKADVLIIDDIGAERATEWIRDEVLYPILQYRMQELKTTFFTSNKNLEDLETHYANTKEGIQPVMSKRVMERIKFLAGDFLLTGENLRNPDEAGE